MKKDCTGRINFKMAEGGVFLDLRNYVQLSRIWKLLLRKKISVLRNAKWKQFFTRVKSAYGTAYRNTKRKTLTEACFDITMKHSSWVACLMYDV